MKVKKPINNNVLCVIDDKGHELIVTGKGIGFGRKFGERVDESKIQKVYRMEGKKEQRKLRELVESIPVGHIALTQDLIDHIRHSLNMSLNESLLITLADHISFAIKRKQEGMEFRHPLRESIMCYYPAEYKLGKYCLKEIARRMHTELIEDEAAFIALHIVNAELNTDMSEMLDITRMIENCIRIVEDYFKKSFDRESLDFSRFTVHLRYFAKRFFQKQMMEGKTDEQDVLFRKSIAASCREYYGCAEQIDEFIWKNYGRRLPEEEKIYLTIHLKRINMNG